MQAIILLAGYGSRLNRDDIPHKSMLPFGNETLLSRHLRILQELGMERTVLVLGHNREAVKQYTQGLDLTMPVEFIDNPQYRTTGNTLSLVLGLRNRSGDILGMDGDVLYPRSVLTDYVRQSKPSSFAVTPVDIDDTEATKVLLNPSGRIESFVTKRDLTPEEKSQFQVAGEAIGFFLLTSQAVDTTLKLYDGNENHYKPLLWEYIFSDLAQRESVASYPMTQSGCIEIDTQEDYDEALRLFESQQDSY